MAPEGQDRRSATCVGRDWERGGILYIFPDRAHMSGLPNGGNLTEGGRNGVEDKKV